MAANPYSNRSNVLNTSNNPLKQSAQHNPAPKPPHVAVVGAGWAGLAAASELHAQGFRVTVYDASHTPGGRARQVDDPVMGTLDNGQHLLSGAYQDTLALMARDVPEAERNQAFTRQRLRLCSTDRQFVLSAPRWLPSSLGSAASLWFAKGLSINDKRSATQLMLRLKTSNGQEGDDQAVRQWLNNAQQSERLIRLLWEPLCLATLNTAIDEASSHLFQRVLCDSLLNPQTGAADLLIPAVDLSTLWPKHVCAKVNSRLGQTVKTVAEVTGGIRVNDDVYDGCIIAVPPHGVQRLFEEAAHQQYPRIFSALSTFEYRPITTCYVDLEAPLTLGEPFMMMRHDLASETSPAPGQWVFDRNICQPGSATSFGRLAFVVSDSTSVLSLSPDDLADQLMKQLARERSPSPTPVAIKASRCFHEKRATFAAKPRLSRPSNETPWRQITFAGDWTDTGYPSVLEGAVKSGLRAANCLARQMPKKSLAP